VGTVDLVSDLRDRAGYDSLPVAARRPALAAAAVAVVGAAALGVRYADEAYPRWLDVTGRSLARDWFPIPREIARAVIGLFDPVPLTVIIVVLAGTCLAVGRRRLAVLAVAGPVVTGLVVTAVKPVIDRTKNGDLAYPSGHMGAAVAVALVVALLMVSVLDLRSGRAVGLLVAVPGATGFVVGLAMTVTNYHYLTDAVGGFCTAVAVVLGLAVLLDRARRNTARGPCDGRGGSHARRHEVPLDSGE
jgi:undecaprenyl-diphosphatase